LILDRCRAFDLFASVDAHLHYITSYMQVLLDATKPQDGLNGTAGDSHGEGGDSGRATGSEVGRP
jgi:hypothetical protein